MPVGKCSQSILDSDTMEWFKVVWVSLLTTVFWLGCLTGFIFQSKEVCEVYFKYQTRASTTMSFDTELPTPSLTACHLYLFILNRTDYKSYGIAKRPPRVASNDDA